MPAHSGRLLLVDQGERHAKEHMARRLVDLGYRLVLVQWSHAVWCEELFEHVVVSRLTHWDHLAPALSQEHARDPFDGVVCYNEGALLAADDIARLLGLPRISRYDAESIRHKDRMRVAWEAAGVPVPRYRVLHGPADARALSTWRFPLVLKPTAMMGSKGVIRVDHVDDVQQALTGVLTADLDIPLGGEFWTLAEAFNLPAVALAEEYVPGTEYSAEGLVSNGDYRLLGITRKILTREPYFDEVGHVFPVADPVPGPAADRGLRELLGRAHSALGVLNGLTHTEFRVDDGRVVLMELNARAAGDHIPMLVDDVLGTDSVELMARCAMGLSPGPAAGAGRAAAPHVAAVAFLTSPPEAHGRRLVKVRVPDLPDNCRLVSRAEYLTPGAIVPYPTGSGTTRLGHVLFRVDNEAAALDVVRLLRHETEVEHAAP